MRVPCEKDGVTVMKHLAFACDCNGRFVELAPEEGAKMAISEVCRNLVCSGAEPIGITDCLNFASPEDPFTMDRFARAVDGLAEACNALGVPIVSGNVSLYNETTDASGRKPILPTPTVAAVGLVRDEKDIVTQWFKRPGEDVLLLGVAKTDGLGGSEYQQLKANKLGGPAPAIDLDAEKKLQALVLDLARSQLLSSAHDVADGGLAVALAECTVGPTHIGAEITLDGWTRQRRRSSARRLPASSSARRTPPRSPGAPKKPAFPIRAIGKTTAKAQLGVRVGTLAIDLEIAAITTARESCLVSIVGAS